MIYVVRHGQDEDNANKILNGYRDMPLTELGRGQARVMAQKFINKHVDIILSSPLKRALETAQIIGDVIGIPVEIYNELIERDLGVLTGKLIVDIPKYATEIIRGDGVDYFLNGEGVESFPDTLERARRILDYVDKKYHDKNVVLVCHSDIAKMIRVAFYGWDFKEGLLTPYFANTDIMELDKENISVA